MSTKSKVFKIAGIMSGTSADGVDAVIIEIDQQGFKLLGSANCDFTYSLRQEIIALNSQTHNELERSQLLGVSLASIYAEVLHDCLQDAGMQNSELDACAAHGQTLRHKPAVGYSLQVINSSLLAELTGIAVIGDFRSRDIAVGGQGAPLACGFHQWAFSQFAPCAVLNLGGFSNLTLIERGAELLGFDCGPANLLLDAWADRHLNVSFDANGDWAASGKVEQQLLEAMQHHPFFSISSPKSTSREDFNLIWLDQLLAGCNFSAASVQATLVALCGWSIAQSLIPYTNIKRVLVCGGGTRNSCLMQSIRKLLPNHKITTTDDYGSPPLLIEAMAFAWLGWRYLTHTAGNLPAVTGAKDLRLLGCYYPA